MNPEPLLSEEFPKMLELCRAHGWAQGHILVVPTSKRKQLKPHTPTAAHSDQAGLIQSRLWTRWQTVHPGRSAFLRSELIVAIIREVSTTCDLHWGSLQLTEGYKGNQNSQRSSQSHRLPHEVYVTHEGL